MCVCVFLSMRVYIALGVCVCVCVYVCVYITLHVFLSFSASSSSRVYVIWPWTRADGRDWHEVRAGQRLWSHHRRYLPRGRTDGCSKLLCQACILWWAGKMCVLQYLWYHIFPIIIVCSIGLIWNKVAQSSSSQWGWSDFRALCTCSSCSVSEDRAARAVCLSVGRSPAIFGFEFVLLMYMSNVTASSVQFTICCSDNSSEICMTPSRLNRSWLNAFN